MFKMKCPKCGAESKISFLKNSYEGPRRCWNCRELFKIKVTNNILIYCKPITEEELEQLQEIDALKSKFKKPPLE